MCNTVEAILALNEVLETCRKSALGGDDRVVKAARTKLIKLIGALE